jgi:hypothetical protein
MMVNCICAMKDICTGHIGYIDKKHTNKNREEEYNGCEICFS